MNHAVMLFRRFLVLQAFLLWQGGFVFYSAIVIPIGTEALGSALLQGLITARVTVWLNLLAIVWLVIILWDILASADSNRRRRMARWTLFGTIALLQVGLFLIHEVMMHALDVESAQIEDRRLFRRWHVAYLWLSTMQWLLALGFSGLTLQSWSREDRISESAI